MRLTRQNRCGLGCVLTELLAAHPEWAPDTVGADGRPGPPKIRVEGTPDELRIDVPDGTDPNAVDAVLTAHDHAAWVERRLGPRRARAAALARLRANPQFADLLAVLEL